MPGDEMDVRQGTVDLLVLKALTWGPMHGYAILASLRRATGGELRLEDAALYPALHRLEARELVEAEWGLSENNRRARYYTLTRQGRAHLRAEAELWLRYSTAVTRVLAAEPALA